MKYLKWALKLLLFIIAIPISYLVISMLVSLIPVSSKEQACLENHKVYFAPSSAIHSDFILPIEKLHPKLRDGLILHPETRFVAFGFGDRNFFEKTPTWGDLTLGSIVIAMLIPSESAMHIIRLDKEENYWYPIMLCDKQLNYLNDFIEKKFALTEAGEKIHISGMSYNERDEFYEANGSFTGFYTCNTWVNEGLKYIGKPACLWTPFSLGIKLKYPKPE